MDAGIMLNMLSGSAGANGQPASADFSVSSQGSSTQAGNAVGSFPAMVTGTSTHPANNATASSQITTVNSAGAAMPQSLSMSVEGQGVVKPEGALNILTQGSMTLDPAVVENIIAHNKVLAGKLDSLLEAGDIEGFTAIMQNIKAIVEQINTGEFDLSNIETMLASKGNMPTPMESDNTPTASHSLSAVQAAASFQPIVQIDMGGATSSQNQLLPADVLTELAELGKAQPSGSVNTTQTTNTMARGAPAAPAVTAATTPATPTQPAMATPAKTSAPAAATDTPMATPNISGNSAAMAAKELAMANNAENAQAAQSILEKNAGGLAVAAMATSKAVGSSTMQETIQAPHGNQVTAEGAALPLQASAQAALKAPLQQTAPAQANTPPQLGQVPTEGGGQASGNGNSSANSSGENSASMNSDGKPNSGGTSSNGNNANSQQQMTQNKPTHQQMEMKAELKAAHTSASPAQQAFQSSPIAAVSPEASTSAAKTFMPDFMNDPVANTGDIRTQQSTITPKPFGGTLTQGLAKDVAKQVGMEVSRAAKNGNTEFTVKLNPIELGKVTIKMAFDKDGTTSLKILAQSPETLALLQRDLSSLERAIEAGGLKSSQADISIELDDRQNGQSAGKAFTEAARDEMAKENRNKHSALNDSETGEETTVNDTTPLEQILAQLDSASGLDIRV